MTEQNTVLLSDESVSEAPAKAKDAPSAQTEAKPLAPIPAPVPRFRVAITAGALRDLLGQVMGVRSRKASLPVLGSVLLEVTPSTLRARMTNLDMTAAGVVAHEDTATPGRVLVPADRLLDVAKVEDKNTMLYLSGKNEDDLEITGAREDGGKWHAVLQGLDPNEFPPERKGYLPGEGLYVQYGVLRRMLQVCLPCISTDSTRYVLNGVYFQQEGKTLRAVGTDGRRLVTVTGGHSSDGDFKAPSFIIPGPAAALLVSLLDDGEEQMEVAVECVKGAVAALRFALRSDGWLETKVIEGNYPNYAQVIPPWESGRAMSRDTFTGAVERAAEFANASVLLRLSPDGRLQAEASTPDAVMWEESVQLFSPDAAPGREILVSVNPEYVPMLRAVSVDTMKVQVPENDLSNGRVISPVVFKATETVAGTDLEATWVLMPMRVTE